MKKYILNIIAITALFFAFSGSIYSQSTVEGYIKYSGNPLYPVRVNISSNESPTYTNSIGYYSFTDIDEGTTVTVTVDAEDSGNQRTIVVGPGINTVSFWFNAVSDRSGNSYGAIEIGSQIWMAENLKTTMYNNGDPIITTTPATLDISGESTPKYQWAYGGDESNVDIYGRLYTFYAVTDGRGLCPTGWHVPAGYEWTDLSNYLGGASIAGLKLKETGTTHWLPTNPDATNETGFTALPGGERVQNGFSNIGARAFWYSSTAYSIYNGEGRDIIYSSGSLSTNAMSNYIGNSVRCINNHFKPTVTTTSVSSIGINSAECGGSISSELTVTSRGICWSTMQNPTTDYDVSDGGSGIGSFNSSLTGLLPNTTYYVRAFATNSAGTAYGNQVSFTTKDVQLEYISGNNQTYPGGGMPLPLVFKVRIFGGESSIYVDDLKVENLSISASASTGHQDGDFNNLNNYCNDGNLTCYGGYYYVEPNTGSDYTLFITVTLKNNGQDVSSYLITESILHWSSSLPTVSTTAISSINLTTAVGGGNITNDNGYAVTSRGVCWSTSQNPTSDLTTKTSDGTGTGVFTSNINGLTPGTKYYVRSYATNISGTGYGNEISFTTYNSDAITDIEGNYYNIVKIGTQTWLKENLKVTHYRNNDEIPNVTDLSSWSNLTSGGYCNYNNDVSNVNLYGRLYNAYATADNRNLCPTGWHVPTEYEWIVLENYLIANGYNYDGTNTNNKIALSMASETNWVLTSIVEGAVGDPNPDYNVYRNKSGFTGLPSGFIYPNPDNPGFHSDGAVWWTSTEVDPTHTTATSIWKDMANETRSWYGTGDLKNDGFSVRCLKGESIVVTNTNDQSTGSLRKALDDANANPGPDVIIFNIPGAGPFTIQPATPLPTITDPVVIDGFSQPGASLATSTQLIQLEGTSAGEGSNGLTINASNCTVRGLIISNFSGNGIQIAEGKENWIKANSIYNNGGLGIKLSESTNNNQSYPVLNKTVISLGNIYIDGTLSSFSGSYPIVDFFASKLADNSGFGEGQTYLGSAEAEPGEGNVFSFKNVMLPYKTIYGDVITATATDPDRNTSEFSKAIGGLPDQTINNLAFDYYVNPNDVPNADPDAIVEAVKAAFNTWNEISTANIAFNYIDNTDEKYAKIDGKNLISFSDDQYEFGDWVLAITAKTLELGATDAETKIMDADIIFNPYFVNHKVWNFGIANDPANAGYFDIQSITTHESGHILGLLHSGVHNATMWFEMDQGIDARSIEQDDISWASYKYPKQPDYNNTFGSISGNIKYGYDQTQPVAGAIVLAINTATKDTVHSYSDALGNYLVPGLKAGSYNVYIEPLDGDVYGRPLTPRNISLYIYTNTVYTDYPAEFYSGTANEKAVETTDIITPVTVSAGSSASGINLITNQDVTPPLVVTVTPPDLSISQDILIKFSEPVDIKTFTGTTCYLVKSGVIGLIGGTYTLLGSQTNIVLFTPGEALNYSTSYTLHITTDVTDLAKVPNKLAAEYQYAFNTGAGDKTPPTITSMIPKAGGGSVFVNTKIQLFFSEAMNTASLTNSFTVTWKNGNVVTNVPGSSSWDPEYKVMTFSPTGSLKEATTYTVKVSNSAKDISGKAIKGNYSATFTTVLVANPTLLYLEPGTALKTEVTVETPVVADFSEPINPFTVDLNSFKLYKGATSGIPVNGKFELLNSNSRVIFRPAVSLDFSQTYTVELTTGIKDISLPNAGTFQGQTATFTTAAKSGTPQIYFISPPSGVIGDTVIIGGKGFDPDPVKDKVEFYIDGVTFVQAKVKSASLSSLKVAVPVGAKSGPIRVTANGAQADYLSPFDFYIVQKYSDPCNTVTGSAQTGGNSHAVALDITAATAYVTNSGTNNVSVIDVASMTVKKTINVGEYPLMIDINPSGTRAYVTNFLSHTVSVIDLASNTVTKTIDVGYNPDGIKVSPDGKRVYIAHYNSDYENVSVIDADPASGGFDHVVANINTGTRNKDLDVDANATTMVVTGDDGVRIIEITKTELGFDYSTYSASSGTKTSNAAIVTEAGLAIVSTMDGALLFIDINKGSDTFGAVLAKSTSGGKAGDLQPDVSGVFLYVSNPYDNQVTVYKMTYGAGGSGIESTGGITLSEISKVPVGMSPQGLAINKFNDQLFVVNEFGTTGSTGSVTKIIICCAGRTPSDDIVAVALYIQSLINTGAISQTDGKMLIRKLNDALANIAAGKNKSAINDLNTFINKVNSSVKTGKIAKGPGQILVDDANAIIARLNGAKSGETESDISDAGLSNRVQKSESIPESRLGLIYPNPFSQTITVNYEIAENKEALTKVQLMVYDVNGRLVSTLVDQMMQPGCYTTSWNGDNDSGGTASYGTYFVLFRAGTVKEVNKIMLIKPR